MSLGEHAGAGEPEHHETHANPHMETTPVAGGRFLREE